MYIHIFVCMCAKSLTKPFFRLSEPGSCAWLSPFLLCADCIYVHECNMYVGPKREKTRNRNIEGVVITRSTETPPQGRFSFVACAAMWTSTPHETQNTSKQDTKKQ